MFSDHMVLASDKPIRVFGEGEGEICVRMAGREALVRAENGHFLAQLEGMECGGPYEMRVRSGSEEVVLRDVHIGRVYLYCGQSNMQLPLNQSDFDLSGCRDEERLRFFTAHSVLGELPFTPENGWMLSRAVDAPHRSALAYISGMELAGKGCSVVGAVCACQGGSVIESWMPSGLPERIGAALAPEDKYKDPCRREWWNEGGELYGHVLLPLFPFSLSGIIWYQGESNAREAEGRIYGRQLGALIEQWRADFMDEELPVIIVQLPCFARCASKEGWAMVQQAQQDVSVRYDHVYTVMSRDLCESTQIHPVKKQALALRIARALEDIPSSDGKEVIS